MKFSDSKQREWVLHIDVAAMRRAKAKGIDLSMPVQQLQQFTMDDVFVTDAIWAVICLNAKERSVDFESFEAALNGPILDAARESLFAALVEYYDPKSQRAQMLLASLEAVKKETAKAISDLSSNPNQNLATT